MADPTQNEPYDLEAFLKDQEENVRVGEDIVYPIEVAKVTPTSPVDRSLLPVGSWVAVRPVTDNPDQKTYLGVYLGELPLKSAVPAYHRKTQELQFMVMTNPGIFVPDLSRVVYGYGSWWGLIKGPDDLKKITNQDIENVWYVKALREMAAKTSGQSS
jgi:hypothetical protein